MGSPQDLPLRFFLKLHFVALNPLPLLSSHCHPETIVFIYFPMISRGFQWASDVTESEWFRLAVWTRLRLLGMSLFLLKPSIILLPMAAVPFLHLWDQFYVISQCVGVINLLSHEQKWLTDHMFGLEKCEKMATPSHMEEKHCTSVGFTFLCNIL